MRLRGLGYSDVKTPARRNWTLSHHLRASEITNEYFLVKNLFFEQFFNFLIPQQRNTRLGHNASLDLLTFLQFQKSKHQGSNVTLLYLVYDQRLEGSRNLVKIFGDEKFCHLSDYVRARTVSTTIYKRGLKLG